MTEQNKTKVPAELIPAGDYPVVSTDAVMDKQKGKTQEEVNEQADNRMTVLEQITDDKEYDASAFSGLGRKNLTKNVVGEKNVLTQAMMSAANTIYVIQYDYDLNGQTITIPANCTIEFDGGSISGGFISSADFSLKVKNLPSNNGVFNMGYNLTSGKEFLVASEIGIMSGEENKSINANILNKVIALHKNISLDGDYYFERYNNAAWNIGYDFTIKGGIARFVGTSTTQFFTIASEGGITFDNVEIYNSSYHFLIGISSLNYIVDKICFIGCKLHDSTRFVQISCPSLDYEETPFGIRKFIITDCKFDVAAFTFIMADVIVTDTFLVSNNNISKLSGLFINIGQTNGREYNTSNRLHWCDVVFDRNTFVGEVHVTGAGNYYTPLVAETNKVFYTNNKIKDLIALEGYPAYDGYLSSNYVVFSGNEITDVMSLTHNLTSSYAFSEIAKAKGSDFLKIENNNWDIDAVRVRQKCADAGYTFTDDIRISHVAASETTPVFAADTYYEYDGANYPVLLTEKPSDWDTNYTNYYIEVQEGGTLIKGEWSKTAYYEKFRPYYGWKLMIFEGNEVHIKGCEFGYADISMSKNVEIHINRNIFDLSLSRVPLIGIYGIYSDNPDERKIFEFSGNTIQAESGEFFSPCSPLFFYSVPNKVNCEAVIQNNISNINLIPAMLVSKSIFKGNIVTPVRFSQNGAIRESDSTDIDITWVSTKDGVVVPFQPTKLNITYMPAGVTYGFVDFLYADRTLHFKAKKIGLDIKIHMVVESDTIKIYNEYGEVISQQTKNDLSFVLWKYNIYTQIKINKITGFTDRFRINIQIANYAYGNVEISTDAFDKTNFGISDNHIKYQETSGVYGLYVGNNKYVDFQGRTAAKVTGTSANRPTSSLNNDDAGFTYFDTTLGKPIYWNGTTWVDATGTAVS